MEWEVGLLKCPLSCYPEVRNGNSGVVIANHFGVEERDRVSHFLGLPSCRLKDPGPCEVKDRRGTSSIQPP